MVTDTAAELLGIRSLEDRHRPWLFYPHGLDWRWLSRHEVASRVAGLAAVVAESLSGDESRGVEMGTSVPSVAFPFHPGPVDPGSPIPSSREADSLGGAFLPVSALVLDLALSVHGMESQPVAISREAGGGARPSFLAEETVWVRPGSRGGVVSKPSLEADRPEGPRGATAWIDDAELNPDGWIVEHPGAVRQEEAAGQDTGTLSAPALALRAARRWVDLTRKEGGQPAEVRGVQGKGLAAGPPPALSRGQEVAVSGVGFGPGERFLVAWTLLTGGALLLEPNPKARTATAAWARPTLFLGDGDEVETLEQEARAWETQWRGGAFRRALRRLLAGNRAVAPPAPFGRLHTLILRDAPASGSSPSGAGAVGGGSCEEWWSVRGVERMHLASLMQ